MRGTATTAVLCLALIYATATAGGAAGEPQPPPSPPGAAADAAGHSITLITGDRVVLDDRGDVASVRPGRGRGQIAYSIRRVGGHTMVVPADASRLIGAGKLDRRLFDVTSLARSGYTDARRRELPLIIETSERRRLPNVAGVRPMRELPAIGGAAVRVARTSTAWQQLAESTSVERIWLDGVRKPLLDQTVPQIGAPEAWRAGYTGRGVKVAVLDSGVDATHPDLAGKVVAARNFTASGPADLGGHGTHVASTIVGSGAASDGRYKGVAPDAQLVSGKVCDEYCLDSDILAGLQWAAVEQGAKVVNLSLGGTDQPEVDPLEEAVDRLTAETGALFVIAAGNDGPGEQTVSSPGSAEAALTVGAVDKQDGLADFSSRGPRTGDGGLKPDLTAPGVGVVAARAANTSLGEPVGEHYVRASGTSMATPHVAGAAALLAQQHPEWKAGQLKAALMSSARPMAGHTADEQGTGRVDVANAVMQQVFAQPASLSYGRQSWPHTDDRPVTKTVTYHNEGDVPVQLEVTGTLTGPDSEPAPDGALRLGATSVSVPAHSSAGVAVTISTDHAGPDGRYTGRLVARAGSRTVGTTLAVEKEIESYDLTIRHLDRSGVAEPDFSDVLFGLDVDVAIEEYSGRDAYTYRLPRGRYLVDSTMFLGDELTGAVGLLRPEVVLDQDTTLTFDGRDGKPFDLRIRRADLPAAGTSAGYYLSTPERPGPWTGIVGGAGAADHRRLFSAQLGAVGAPEALSGYVHAGWAKQRLVEQDELLAAPDVYVAHVPVPGRFPSGFTRRFREGDFATLDYRHAAARTSARADAWLSANDGVGLGTFSAFLFESPARLRWHVTVEQGVTWEFSTAEWAWTEDGYLVYGAVHHSGRLSDLAGGRTYRDRWNVGVLGPGFPPIAPAIVESGPWAYRSGDTIRSVQPLYTDQHNHAGDFGDVGTLQTTLYRDGSPVATDPWLGLTAAGLPASTAEYRLETTAGRTGEVSPLASKSSVAWTFRSGSTAAGSRNPLPLWVIRFQPTLDDLNRNPGGRVHLLPFVAYPQPGSAAGRLLELTIEISVDDGATWSRAPLLPGLALARLPAGAEWVSLRARAEDSKGNRVEQTLIRAYRIR